MKIVTTNMNTVRDLQEIVFKSLGLTSTISTEMVETRIGGTKGFCEEATVETDITGLEKDKLDFLKQLLYVRINAGQLSCEDITESDIEIISEEEIQLFFACTFIKVCYTATEKDDYEKVVLANANTNAKVDLKAQTTEWGRITADGYNVTDVVTYNLCKTDWAILDKMSFAFNLKNNAKDFRETKIQPMNMAIATFGDEVVRTMAGSVSEMAGNVVSTTVNAVTEAGKSFAYSFSRDIKVGDILTDDRAKTIVPNLKAQGVKLASLVHREKKQKRIGMR